MCIRDSINAEYMGVNYRQQKMDSKGYFFQRIEKVARQISKDTQSTKKKKNKKKNKKKYKKKKSKSVKSNNNASEGEGEKANDKQSNEINEQVKQVFERNANQMVIINQKHKPIVQYNSQNPFDVSNFIKI
eukprot:TRINITY_DN37041_c0_g1_i1.p2 TRINITY_DN37041_c0_g1~~TRINITY_DN37041_c0_g1_i1.p2  ORF type:complete len:131 (-),score=34.46 TRINITY_DN37041_c0_g1_i1:193-585(-)